VSPFIGQVPLATTPGGPIYAADAATQGTLQTATLQQNGILRATARAFNWWGGPGAIWTVAVLWIAARALRRRALAELGLRGTEVIAISAAVSGIVKGFAGRARPWVTPGEPWHFEFARGWVDARFFSMPSGHTTVVFALGVAVCMLSTRWPLAPRVATVIGAFAAALLVAFARLYTNQHWLSDVIAGAALGSCTGFVITRFHVRHPHSAFDRLLLGAGPARTPA
jgi:membrane-associated phospholipid phosphatase